LSFCDSWHSDSDALCRDIKELLFVLSVSVFQFGWKLG